VKTKFIAISLLFFALMLTSLAINVYAFDCGMKKECHMNLEDKFFEKLALIMSNREELSLSEEQVAQIKDLKISSKKNLIRTDAEIDIAELDIKVKMWEDPIDTNAISVAIDKKYELKKEKDKSLVVAYTTLKGMLTEEQKAKLKELHKKCKMQPPMDKGKMCECGMKCPMMGGGN